jgi:transposase InsO family protein
MAQILNGILWVTRQELLECGVSEGAIRRRKFCTFKRGVYAYEDLPKNWQQALKDGLWQGMEYKEYCQLNRKKQEEYKAKPLKEYTLLEGWQNYLSLYENILNKEMYAKSAACLCNFIAKIGNTASLPQIRKHYHEYLATVQNNGLVLPENKRVLQRKIQSYLAEIPVQDIVCPKRQGNQNAAKHNEKLYAFVVEKRANPNNYTGRHIWRLTKEFAKQNGYPEPSLAWVKNILKDKYTKLITKEGRYGEKAGGFIPATQDIQPGAVWQIDGTRINFIPHYYNGEKKALYIVAVLDVATRYIVGYSLCHSESYVTVSTALQNAVQNAGYLPKKLIMDKFPGHNTEQAGKLFKKLRFLGTELLFTSSPTGKSHVERTFGTLQTVFMQDIPYYYGEGIQSTRPYAHKSEKALKNITQQANREGFDYETACKYAHQVIRKYNTTPVCEYSDKKITQSPAELHAHAQGTPVQEYHIPYLFWEKREVTVRENLIEYHENYQEHYFFVYDTETLKKVSGKKVEIYTNHETIYIFLGNQYVACAERTLVQPNDWKAINELKNQRKQLQKDLKNELKAITDKLTENTTAEHDESSLLLKKTAPKQVKEQNETALLKSMLEDPYDYI